MKINEKKSNYMVFSRSQEKFATRLNMNGVLLETVPATKLLGVWVTEELSSSRNCSEICKKAYSRLTMLTKLKYVGTKTEDLIDIYIYSISEAWLSTVVLPSTPASHKNKNRN